MMENRISLVVPDSLSDQVELIITPENGSFLIDKQRRFDGQTGQPLTHFMIGCDVRRCIDLFYSWYGQLPPPPPDARIELASGTQFSMQSIDRNQALGAALGTPSFRTPGAAAPAAALGPPLDGKRVWGPLWLLFAIGIPLLFCVGLATWGYLELWPQVRDELTADITIAIADSIDSSVTSAISASQTLPDELILTEADLDANNAESIDEVGFEIDADGNTTIYGTTTEISPDGIEFVFLDTTFAGIPVVQDGRIEMTELEEVEGMFSAVLPDDMFEESFERGINDALEDANIEPVSVTLREGSMVIETIAAR